MHDVPRLQGQLHGKLPLWGSTKGARAAVRLSLTHPFHPTSLGLR